MVVRVTWARRDECPDFDPRRPTDDESIGIYSPRTSEESAKHACSRIMSILLDRHCFI